MSKIYFCQREWRGALGFAGISCNLAAKFVAPTGRLVCVKCANELARQWGITFDVTIEAWAEKLRRWRVQSELRRPPTREEHSYIQAAELERCHGCAQLIDPDTCCCGDKMGRGDHTSYYYESHMFVPMGCNCLRATDVDEELARAAES